MSFLSGGTHFVIYVMKIKYVMIFCFAFHSVIYCIVQIMHASVHRGPLLSKPLSWDGVRAQRKANPNEDIVKALIHPGRAVIIGR